MSFVDMILISSLYSKFGDNDVASGRFMTSFIAGSVAVFQLGVYNLMGRKPDGDMVGEVPAHYCEFAFEIISSLIAFWFCMDNKVVAEKEIGIILRGRHLDFLCGSNMIQFEQSNKEGPMIKPRHLRFTSHGSMV